MIRYPAVILMLAMPLLSGCFFETYHETQTFDLEQARPCCPAKTVIEVKDFENLSGAGQKMRYRAEQYRIVIDGYNKWVQAPDIMISRYFMTAFSQSGVNMLDERSYILSGTLNSFEINLTTKTVYIQITCQLKERKTGEIKLRKELSVSAAFKQDSPVEFAEAASKAVRELTEKLSAEIAAVTASRPAAGKN
ncbi:MAG: hypothetical protein WCV67_04215 [Victivallaceae bacterium]|jgi:ABC-type uncharacterized transport system auxiliary subunit